MELRFTDNTQQAIAEHFRLSPEALAKVNFALTLAGTTHPVESLQTHCELSSDDAESLAIALHLLSKVNYSDPMINKPKITGVENLSKDTLYIRNLPLTITQEELSAAFDAFGSVKEIRTQKDKATGEFSGCVFVEYVDPNAAKLAQIQLDGHVLGINKVHVSYAFEKNPLKLPEGSASYPTSAVPSNPSATVFVAGIGPETDVNTVKQLFARFGEIENARLLTDKASGQSKGVAFVDFKLPVSAAAAIDAMNNQMYNGKPLKVSYATQGKVNKPTTTPYPAPYSDPYSSFPGYNMQSYY